MALPKATRKDARRFIGQAFEDRISWTAATTLLERVRGDAGFDALDAETRAAIERFLERHPAPVTARSPRG